MEKLLERQYKLEVDGWETSCPYRGGNICHASISSMLIDEDIKENYCDNENYDNCPIFLSKVLRKGCIKIH
ncbi:MAG: hypothetical protein ABIB41_05125 [Nitrospirota bacterium]|jgi:hypothetical protein